MKRLFLPACLGIANLCCAQNTKISPKAVAVANKLHIAIADSSGTAKISFSGYKFSNDPHVLDDMQAKMNWMRRNNGRLASMTLRNDFTVRFKDFANCATIGDTAVALKGKTTTIVFTPNFAYIKKNSDNEIIQTFFDYVADIISPEVKNTKK